MDQQLFSIIVQRWADHLSGEDNIKFENILKLSKANGRIRNICGFLALASEDSFNEFTNLSQCDRLVGNIRLNLVKALIRLEKESNPEISTFAKLLKSKYFDNFELLSSDEYDVSAEMAKLFKTMINSYRLVNKDIDENFKIK